MRLARASNHSQQTRTEVKGAGSPQGRRSLQRDREQQNRGTGHSRDRVALTGTYGALPDNGRSILHVSNCKFKMQQILFKMSRIFGNKEDSLFLFISNFLLYHHNFLFHKRTERPRTGTAQSRGLDPAPAGRTSMGSPHRAPQR